MRTCRNKKPFIVTEMTKNDFVGVQNIEKKIVNRKVSVDGEKINWLHIRAIKMEKSEPFLLKVQLNSFSDPFQTINIKKREILPGRPTQENIFLNSLTPLWPKGKPIADAKLNNLKEMFHLIPKDCYTFYENLKGSANIQEDIDGFNVEDLDFEVED